MEVAHPSAGLVLRHGRQQPRSVCSRSRCSAGQHGLIGTHLGTSWINHGDLLVGRGSASAWPRAAWACGSQERGQRSRCARASPPRREALLWGTHLTSHLRPRGAPAASRGRDLVANWRPKPVHSHERAGGQAARLRQTRPQFAGGPRRVRQASMSCSPVHTRVTVGNNQGQRWRGQWSGNPGPHPVLRPRACLLPFPPPRRRPGPWGARGTAPSPREAAGRPGPPPHPEGAGSGWGAPRARPRELRARVATGSDGDQCLPELRCSWAGTLSSLRVYGPSSQLVKSKDTVRSDGRERGARASAGLHLPTLRTRGF